MILQRPPWQSNNQSFFLKTQNDWCHIRLWTKREIAFLFHKTKSDWCHRDLVSSNYFSAQVKLYGGPTSLNSKACIPYSGKRHYCCDNPLANSPSLNKEQCLFLTNFPSTGWIQRWTFGRKARQTDICTCWLHWVIPAFRPTPSDLTLVTIDSIVSRFFTLANLRRTVFLWAI